jgi:hypothetical protein
MRKVRPEAAEEQHGEAVERQYAKVRMSECRRVATGIRQNRKSRIRKTRGLMDAGNKGIRYQSQSQHEDGTITGEAPPVIRPCIISQYIQGNDGLLPGSTPAGKQNPETLAPSVSLLTKLSVPWENDRPWGFSLLRSFPELGGTGGTGVQGGGDAFSRGGGDRENENEVMVLGEEGREEDIGSNIFATRLVHRRKDEERL